MPTLMMAKMEKIGRKEHSIIFSTDMVQAILEGRKTQTRRVIKPQHNVSRRKKEAPSSGAIRFIQSVNPQCWIEQLPVDLTALYPNSKPTTINNNSFKCPYGQVGDRLWVKEKHQLFTPISRPSKIIINYPSNYKKACDPTATRYIKNPNKLSYYPKWRSSRFMPRWASRITLEITGVRVERLQEINPLDVDREGIDYTDLNVGKAKFKHLWDSLNAKRGYGWETNCWVWVIEFRRL